MICNVCLGETHVIDTRITAYNHMRRRRECTRCGARSTTYESHERPAVGVLLPQEKRPAPKKGRKSTAWRSNLDPEKRSLLAKRGRLRAMARVEARETGEPVEAIYHRWGVGQNDIAQTGNKP